MTNPYSLVQPTYKQYDNRGHITPNFEFSEGVRPAGEFQVAKYLPSVSYNKFFEEHFVISGGKVVAFDGLGALVPAGLRRDITNYKTAYDADPGAAAAKKVAGRAAAQIKYAQIDVDRGVKNYLGALVTVGEPVVESFLTITGATATVNNQISNPVGVASYNYWAHPGGDGLNPAQYNTYNFNLQARVAFVCDYQIEVPVVADNTAYAAAPYKGMGAMIAALGTALPGKFVTYDVNSNYVLSSDSNGYDYGTTTKASEVIGQILSTDNRTERDLLGLVRTRYNGFGDLEKMPGTATEGKSDTLTYSGGYGLVRINLILR